MNNAIKRRERFQRFRVALKREAKRAAAKRAAEKQARRRKKKRLKAKGRRNGEGSSIHTISGGLPGSGRRS